MRRSDWFWLAWCVLGVVQPLLPWGRDSLLALWLSGANAATIPWIFVSAMQRQIDSLHAEASDGR